MPDFLDLLILMVVVWTAGTAFRLVGMPMVFGELVGGILVGPAVLNIVHPGEVINVLAELGIFFLMLHAGLKTDHEELLGASKASVFVAMGGMILPFAVGYAISQMFGFSTMTSLFMALGVSTSGIAMAARFLRDYKIAETPVGHISLSAAVISDIVALIFFSLFANIAEQGSVDLLSMGWLLIKVTSFFVIIIIGGMEASHLLSKVIYKGNKSFTITLIMALSIGIVAELIGLHMIIGAFLAGLFIREEVIDKDVFNRIEDRYYGLTYGFLAPVFFASLAFHLELTALFTAPILLLSFVTIAIVGKVVGAGLVALLAKRTKEESMLIGLALNNRGAIELVIASIGLQMNIIDETLFSIMIFMTFATTIFSLLAGRPFVHHYAVTKTEESPKRDLPVRQQ